MRDILHGSLVCNGLAERRGVAVGRRVVGDDAVDPLDAVSGEIARGADEEPGGGRAISVGEELGIAEAGVVIDGDMDVVLTNPAVSDLL